MKKTKTIVYWIATLWLASGMIASGVFQLLKAEMPGAVAPPGAEGMRQLGYPVYALSLIGVWKLAGIIVLLIPGRPLLKEWAYAGFVFLLTGALYTHLVTGGQGKDLFPAAWLLLMTAVSWYLRPASRRLVPSQQTGGAPEGESRSAYPAL